MTDLSTTNLKRLLDEAAPGPWEYVPGEAPDERCIVNLDTTTPCIAIVADEAGSDCTDADLTLAAAAPQLAQEVLRMRAELNHMAEDVATIDGDPQYSQVEWLFAAFTSMKLRSIIGVRNLGDQDG